MDSHTTTKEGGWTTGICEGHRTKIIRVGNCTVRLHRPILSPEEQNKRENDVKLALITFGNCAT